MTSKKTECEVFHKPSFVREKTVSIETVFLAGLRKIWTNGGKMHKNSKKTTGKLYDSIPEPECGPKNKKTACPTAEKQ